MGPFTRYFSGRTIGHQVQEKHTEGSKTSGLIFIGHSPQGTVKLEMHTNGQGEDQLSVSLFDPEDETKHKELYKGALSCAQELPKE